MLFIFLAVEVCASARREFTSFLLRLMSESVLLQQHHEVVFLDESINKESVLSQLESLDSYILWLHVYVHTSEKQAKNIQKWK